jgi:TolA-binding protein
VSGQSLSRISAVELAGRGPARSARLHADQAAFSEILTQYQLEKSALLEERVNRFVSQFPESPLSDNAVYLLSLRLLEESQNDRAESLLRQLLRDRPTSSKAPAARLNLALLQLRRGQAAEAKGTLNKVRETYPGSVEAFRAQLELQAQGVKR